MSKKIDAMVAEKVIGWRWQTRLADFRVVWCFPPDRPLLEADREKSVYGRTGPVGDFEFTELTAEERAWYSSGKYHYQLPEYSTDISAAWAVVEKMKVYNWRGSIEDFGNRYRINFSKGPLWQAFNSVEHVYVPLGICLAALRAVAVPESEIQEALK